jgi:hypothetical protein
MIIFIIIGLVLVIGTLVTLYFTGVIKFSSSSSSVPKITKKSSDSSNSGICSSNSGSGGNSHVTENFLTGAWINKDGAPWSITPNMDVLLLASYTPNPYSNLYDCTSVMSLFPDNPDLKTALNAIVSTAKTKARYVLLSIGGSSFGDGEWAGMLHKYYQADISATCQCPAGSYWFNCTGVDESSCCSDADKANGKCGGTFEITYNNNGTPQNCCGYASNPHKCCCGNGSTLQNVGGELRCVASGTHNTCNVPGVSASDYTALNTCLAIARQGNDINATMQCKFKYGNSAVAYADMLVATDADGIDFDFEITETSGKLSAGLILFANDLRAEMRKRNKPLILTLTILSGDAYGSMYGPIYDILKTNNSPFDYVVPMLYNGGQYSYMNNPLPTSGFYWNGLLNTWARNYLTKGISNTKLLPAFICYSNSTGGRPSNEQASFECSDLKHYINDYIINPAENAVVPVGALYFYYATEGYDTNKLTDNIKNTMCYFKNNKNVTCDNTYC